MFNVNNICISSFRNIILKNFINILKTKKYLKLKFYNFIFFFFFPNSFKFDWTSDFKQYKIQAILLKLKKKS